MQGYARLNWGDWIADCPEPWCNCAHDVLPSQAHVRCRACRHSHSVAWPEEGWRTIEAAVSERPPGPQHRRQFHSWNPGESVAMLEAENMAQPWNELLARHGMVGA